MEIYKEGDKSKAICSHCKKIVPTTFQVRTAQIKDGDESYKVPNVLVGVCDVCESTVSVPQQSFTAVAEVRKKAEKESFDVRLPRHLLDILNNSIAALGVDVSADLRGQLLRLYLASCDEKNTSRLKENLKSDLLKGSFKRQNRLSMRMTGQLEDHIEKLIKSCKLKKTELVDSLIVDIKADLLDKKDPVRAKELRRALLAAG